MIERQGFGASGGLAVALVLIALLNGCSVATVRSPAPVGRAGVKVQRPPTELTMERRQVDHLARKFMTQFQHRAFGAQWAELATPAQAEWPGKLARGRMLTAKFGMAAVRWVHVGHPRANATWISRENTRRTVSHTWRVPVQVRFAHPRYLKPGGVAAHYAHLDLSLTASRRRAQVVGEGPASVDAPLLIPARARQRYAHVPILMYHRVAPYPQRSQWTDSYGYSIEYGLTVSPAQFAGEMAYLHTHHYRAISLTLLSDHLLYGLPLPRHAVVLTFDDGRRSPWFYAVPVLRRYGFTAEFFPCTSFMGGTNQTPNHRNVQRYLSWDQITKLARRGFWIEDHGTKDQVVLWGAAMARLRREAQQSARLLATHSGEPVQFIAYTGALWPYPAAAQVGPAQTLLFSRLGALGYAGAVVDARTPSVSEATDELWHLPRVRVSPAERLAAFAASL